MLSHIPQNYDIVLVGFCCFLILIFFDPRHIIGEFLGRKSPSPLGILPIQVGVQTEGMYGEGCGVSRP